MTWELHHGDALRVSDLIPAGSVDLIVTSPPYFGLRSYRDRCEACDGTGQAPEGAHTYQEAGGQTPGECRLCGNVPDAACHAVASVTPTAATFTPQSFHVGTGRKSAGGAQFGINEPSESGCPACAGSGTQHYDGQIGSEATPAEFLDALVACTRDWLTVLRPGGSIFVNLGDKYSQRTLTRRSSHQPGMFPGKFDEFDESWAERAANGATRMPAQNVMSNGEAVREKSLMGLPWRYALRCMDELGLILRAEIIWDKPNGLPESVTDRVRRSHEQWFHFTREARYHAEMDEIREPSERTDGLTWEERKAGGEPMRAGLDSAKGIGNVAGMASNPLGKVPGSVWSIASEPLTVPDSLGVDHFAAFPSEWPRRIVLGWCPPHDGVVLDPFCGTGTTVAVAHLLGRHGIGVDLSKDYLRLAEWRCTKDRALRSKVLDRSGLPKPPKCDGQLDLFSEAAS